MIQDTRTEFMLSDIDNGIPPQAAPVLDEVAMAAGQEAPTSKRQRKQAKQQELSLRELYKQAQQEALKENPEDDRKPFKWGDLSKDQKNDVLLRLGLNLMQHAPQGIGLSGVGKAGAQTLGHLDKVREADRSDARGRRESAGNEAMTLAQLANMDRTADARNRQLVQGSDGFYLADLSEGSANPLTTGDGDKVTPAASARDSVFQQKYQLARRIAAERGIKGTKAEEYALNYAGSNRTHVDPGTYIRARGQVMDTLVPNGRPSRELRDLMERTGKSAQEIVNEHTEQLLSRYQQQYGFGESLSDFGGVEPGSNPFILDDKQ